MVKIFDLHRNLRLALPSLKEMFDIPQVRGFFVEQAKEQNTFVEGIQNFLSHFKYLSHIFCNIQITKESA